MNTVLEKGNIIAKIRRGEDLNQIIDYVKSEIYQNGPRSSVVLEIASYFKLFQPEYFKKYEQEIITTMGLFFKHPQIENLAGSVFEMYHQELKGEFGSDYTPMQADILKKIRDLQYFSFSAQQVQENLLSFDILFLNVPMMWLLLFHQGLLLTNIMTD